ncbi:MAG: hypothetical protein IJ463_00830, partial [Bacilli bacterium]|nr:hypothetical protein [Bacilli bacterium]
MKKIIKLIVLVFVCFLPVMVDAKLNYEQDWYVFNRIFWYKDNDEYNFLYARRWEFRTDYVYSYDENGELLEEKTFEDVIGNDKEAYLKSEKFDALKKLISSYYGELYDEKNDMFCYPNYYDKKFYCYDEVNDVEVQKNFDDDLSYTKSILGKRYDLYLEYKDVYYVDYIENFDDYYVMYYYDSNIDAEYAAVLDSDYNKILSLKQGDFYYSPYVHDDLIYVAVDNVTINIYTKDGNKLDSIKVDHPAISEEDYDTCDGYSFHSISISGNELFVNYSYNQCDERIIMRNEREAIDDNVSLDVAKFISFKYTLEYDIETVSSSEGEFTYETKVDENGESYVELKITPKDGYSVEEIIVTDANGERIEVTNNKFYR